MAVDLFEPQTIIARHTQNAPVDVGAIARDLGITVYSDTNMPPDIAGKIVGEQRGSPSGYSIYINASDPPRRRRFTLAHEIAHFVLHRDLIGDGLIDDGMYRSKLGGDYERQANRFAADILMPPALVRGFYRGGTVSYAALGEAFGVSTDAMRIRLQELRLG
jgi:Zn-dependent peptidase ImmA (M78 family)